MILDERTAMREALAAIGDHEICVIFYDDLTLAHEVLEQMGAEPLTSLETLRLFSDELPPAEIKTGQRPGYARVDGQVEFAR